MAWYEYDSTPRPEVQRYRRSVVDGKVEPVTPGEGDAWWPFLFFADILGILCILLILGIGLYRLIFG